MEFLETNCSTFIEVILNEDLFEILVGERHSFDLFEIVLDFFLQFLFIELLTVDYLDETF